MKKINFAIKLVIRNEYDFLHEWFQYYISLGFMNYIIYDDESNDGTKKLIEQYSKIINIHYHIINTSLKKHYDHVFNYKQYDYIFFFDIDEFLYISPKINLIKFLNNNYKNKNSVIQIPGIEVGNKENYNKNICDLECFKYDYLCKPSLKGNATLIIKPKDKIKTYFTKHIFNPKFSIYKSGHTSKPYKGYNIVSEFNNLNYTGKWFFEDKVDNILKYNIILFHFDTKCEYINNKKLKNHRFKQIHPNRKNNDMIKKKLNNLIIQNKIHINYSKNIIRNFFNKYGYYIISNFFSKKQIDEICNEAQDIYKTQMLELNIIGDKNITQKEFENSIKILFNKHFKIFINCEKQYQYLISSYKLSLDNKLMNYLKFLGINKKNLLIKLVLFSNNKFISKNNIIYTVSSHQDLDSIKDSTNNIVILIPLIDINLELCSIELKTKSYKENLTMIDEYKENEFISFDLKKGDIILLNSFVVNKS